MELQQQFARCDQPAGGVSRAIYFCSFPF
jgi:hypothetical protein